MALKLPNGPEFAAAWFGALQLGAIVVPLNVLLAPPEVDERVRIAGARLLVDDPTLLGGGLEPMPDVADRAATDPAVILFTSGTSGRAKGAVLTHGGVRFAADAAAGALGLTPEDVVLGAAPFSHVLGQSTGLVGTLSAGASIAIVERFEAESTLRFMTDTGTTIVTFLMVFLIQNTQNRDTEAIQVKLDELIRATRGAHNALLDLEELEGDRLEEFRRKYEALAKAARAEIQRGEADTGTPEA